MKIGDIVKVETGIGSDKQEGFYIGDSADRIRVQFKDGKIGQFKLHDCKYHLMCYERGDNK